MKFPSGGLGGTVLDVTGAPLRVHSPAAMLGARDSQLTPLSGKLTSAEQCGEGRRGVLAREGVDIPHLLRKLEGVCS